MAVYEQLAAKSIVNCHAMGVDSLVMADPYGSKMARVFIAHKDHELWRNLPGESIMSVGYHAHHCDVLLKPIYGAVFNLLVRPSELRLSPKGCYREFMYQSPITGEKGTFVATGNRCEFSPWIVRLSKKTIEMKAKEVHTIYVPRGEEAAWYVFEGAEDPIYTPLTWSNANLEKFDFKPLYQPMTVERYRELEYQLIRRQLA